MLLLEPILHRQSIGRAVFIKEIKEVLASFALDPSLLLSWQSEGGCYSNVRTQLKLLQLGWTSSIEGELLHLQAYLPFLAGIQITDGHGTYTRSGLIIESATAH